MNIQRNLLLVGMFAVAYLMLMAWTEDYGNAKPTQAVANELPTLSSSASIEDGTYSAEDDVSPAGEALPIEIETTAQTTTESFITIITPELNVKINTLGGDIISLALPKYSDSIENKDEPFELLQRTVERDFYAVSALSGGEGTDQKGQRMAFYSDSNSYEMLDGENILAVDLKTTIQNGVNITKRYIFNRDSYEITVKYLVENNGQQEFSAFQYNRLVRDGSEDPGMLDTPFPVPTFMGVAYWSNDQPYNKQDLDDIMEEPLRLEQQGGWVAWVQHYFVTAWINDDQLARYVTKYNEKTSRYEATISTGRKTVQVGETEEFTSRLYAGPKIQATLENIANGLELTVDYGWLWFIAQGLFWLLITIQGVVGNWGVSIILLTLCIKAVFFKLSASSYKSMAKMRKVTPELTRIREQYKADRQKQSTEMMALYKKEKINPLGGCLPIVIQMPFFISLYWVLLESVELRQAPFFGYLQDLSAMDPYFILPLLMIASMWFQMSLNPTPPDPMQAKVMKMMPFIFGIFFIFFPAGLVLYWLTNNVISIAQQYVITKHIIKD